MSKATKHRLKLLNIMQNYNNIKQQVQELFRQNIQLYPESYFDLNNDNKVLNQAFEIADSVAAGYYENRDESETIRDSENNVDIQDYKDWCKSELNSFIEEVKEGNHF